jgi:hypothetical protein
MQNSVIVSLFQDYEDVLHIDNVPNNDWIMMKKMFVSYKRSKLHPKIDGPFQVLKQINDNAK